MANEREDAPGQWTAERLKQTLNRHLHGEKIVILANREPYIHQRTPTGQIEVQHPASGLVTALEPVMRACSGVWVAHGSGSADRETVDRHDSRRRAARRRVLSHPPRVAFRRRTAADTTMAFRTKVCGPCVMLRTPAPYFARRIGGNTGGQSEVR